MLFDNNNIDYSFLNLTGIQKNNMDSYKFLSAKEGFLRGNMFKDEYKPYKNLTYINIKPKNDKEAKLFNVMQYAFAITDMNLYLDVNPNDKKAFELLKTFIEEEKKAKKEYINSYGPLDICDVSKEKYDWVNTMWPWENMGGSMYV